MIILNGYFTRLISIITQTKFLSHISLHPLLSRILPPLSNCPRALPLIQLLLISRMMFRSVRCPLVDRLDCRLIPGRVSSPLERWLVLDRGVKGMGKGLVMWWVAGIFSGGLWLGIIWVGGLVAGGEAAPLVCWLSVGVYLGECGLVSRRASAPLDYWLGFCLLSTYLNVPVRLHYRVPIASLCAYYFMSLVWSHLSKSMLYSVVFLRVGLSEAIVIRKRLLLWLWFTFLAFLHKWLILFCHPLWMLLVWVCFCTRWQVWDFERILQWLLFLGLW